MKKSAINTISLIVPVFNQEKTVRQDIKGIIKTMDKLRYPYEIIVVVDGMSDRSYEEACKIKSSKLHVIGYSENKGKGNAVRFGMAKAKGEIIAFIDSGMDLNPNGISMLLEHFEWYQADIIVGSKLHPASKVNYPFARKILSFGYRSVVKCFFGLSVKDTQVGIKLFKRETLEAVLPRLLVKTYAFDIEILVVAYYLGFRRIYEAPVELDFTGNSSVTSSNFWKVISLMLWDTASVFYRLKILRYYDDVNKKNWKFDPDLNFRPLT